MLTTLAILAVVGGALAFKVKQFANVYCRSNSGPQWQCNLVPYTTQFIAGAVTTTNPCPDETIFYTDNYCNRASSKIETLNTLYQTEL